MVCRLAEHCAHRRPGPGTSRQPVGAAGPEPGGQHHDGQDQKEQHADLPSLVREEPLGSQRHQERTE